MRYGSVSDVSVEAVVWKLCVEFQHPAVSVDFSEDGCRADMKGALVSLDEGFLWVLEVWNGLVPVDKDDSGDEWPAGQRVGNGSAHGEESRLEDVQAIDLFGTGFPDAPGFRVFFDGIKEDFSFALREELRVVNSVDLALGVEDDSAGDHGTTESPASSLIDSNDGRDTLAEK